MEQKDELRLQVFLSKSGIASRRKSAELIEEGRVTVNGKPVREPGYRVKDTDKIRFDGTSVSPEEEHIYLMLHKPARFISSSNDPEGRPTVMDLVQDSFHQRLFSIGRLDFMSTGLLLLTNDGDFAHTAAHPRSAVVKQYMVESKEPIPRELLQQWMEGIRVEGVLYRLKKFQFINQKQVLLYLTEGKNREIRNVFDHGKLKITRLHRVQFGELSLGNLKEGKFRQLSKTEVEQLLKEASENIRPGGGKKKPGRSRPGLAGKNHGKGQGQRNSGTDKQSRGRNR